MAEEKSNIKTSKKRPAKPFVGNEGKKFSAEHQPTPEAKRLGWEEWRKERNLTQGIIKELLGEDGQGKNLKEYMQSLIANAKDGNPKAIDAVNKCLEDDIAKVAMVDPSGNAVPQGPFQVQIVPPTE
jgi:dsDNA-specific endonuclease/ATPase MutS2